MDPARAARVLRGDAAEADLLVLQHADADPRADARIDRVAGVQQVESVAEALAGADAAVLVTEWAELGELDWGEARTAMGAERPVFIDGRNMLDPETMRAAGWIYESIGRPGA